MNNDAKIYVAGHLGLVGSAIWRVLRREGYSNLVGYSRRELDLLNQSEVEDFFKNIRPEYVFLAAAKVGGIHANKAYPADFVYSNMQIQNNVIDACYRYKAKKLLFLGSSCIYPKYAEQPIAENQLLNGKLEPTNEPYAIAKIAGIITCQSYNRQYGTNYISVMPTNLYGPGDNYHPDNSHVIPGLIRRFHTSKLHDQKEVVVWGTGMPRREFLYSDDLARACVFLMRYYDVAGQPDGGQIVNIGSGVEITIKELAEIIKQVVGYTGRLTFDASKPDGTPRKLLNSTKLHDLGWTHSIGLEEGLRLTYADYLANLELSL